MQEDYIPPLQEAPEHWGSGVSLEFSTMGYIIEDIVILVFNILLRCAWGTVCHYMAEKRGRHPKIALSLGFIFTIFAVIGYAIAGHKNE